MTTLVIRDLDRTDTLDRKALSETVGGRRRPRRPIYRPGKRQGYYNFIPLGGFLRR